jgi:hypothetical protein
MALKTKIGKADFEKLPDALKTEYIADGDGYKLDADYEDVTGLKANRDEVLKQLAEAKKAMKAYEGLDPEAARKALETATAAEDEKLKAAGEFDKLREQLEQRHKAELDKAKADHDSLLQNLKRESLKTLLTSKDVGVLPDRVKGIIAEGDLENTLEFVSDEHGFRFKKKGGIGDAAELAEIFTGLKEKAAWGFAATGALGSGATGSDTRGGSTAKTMPHAQWKGLTPQEQAAFIKEGGKPVE